MMHVVHITAHLGGGVGRVLSRLVQASGAQGSHAGHTIVCLEVPEKLQFVEHISAHGGRVLVRPSRKVLDDTLAAADIVQVEWWHHPVVAQWLCSDRLPPIRMVVWAHVSGLYPPEIPTGFVIAPHRFLFTSPCSWEHPRMSELSDDQKKCVDVVHSSGGFNDFPLPSFTSRGGPLRFGYIGTLNFAKLHPKLLDFLEAVSLPEFRLALVGDAAAGEDLRGLALSRRLEEKLEFRGYKSDVASELAGFDVLVYLLNPMHYGTTENALLEAMAMGVVPVVLNNPAERYLVEHGKTGLVVDSPDSFAKAISFLSENPDKREELSRNASTCVRERFSSSRTALNLKGHYDAVMNEPKRSFDFRPIFGASPSEWFASCQGPYMEWLNGEKNRGRGFKNVRGPHFLYEKTKSSVFHFRDLFPLDKQLATWAERLEETK